MNNLENLIEHFKKFPGIGARQARRFAMHLLIEDDHSNKELATLISTLKDTISPCARCQRFVARHNSNGLCTICGDGNRDTSKLLIVHHDTDVTAIERAGVYDGTYFVFGGTVPLLDTTATKVVRAGMLRAITTENHTQIAEIILAFSANPDGDNTARFVESILKEIIEETPGMRITHLGRGLSTGSELEYADPDTIQNALQNRR